MKPPLKAYFNQICFGLAIISQLFHAHIFFTYTGSDRNQQILASINFLDQQGFSAIEANPDDLSQKIYNPIIGWPPGYNLLIISVNSMVNDWFISAEILALLGALLVLLSIHFLLKTLKTWIHPWVYPALFLFLTISFTPFHYTTASGEWALGFFLIGVNAILKLFKIDRFDDKKSGIVTLTGFKTLSALFFSASITKTANGQTEKTNSLLHISLVILPFFLAGLTRYFYYPMVFLLPGVIFLMIFWFKKKSWPIFLKSIFIALITFVGLLIIDFPAHSRTGNVAEMSANSGFFLDNLLRFDAFPIKAFFYVSLEGLTNKFGDFGVQIEWIAKLIMFFLSGFLISLLFSNYSKSTKPENTVQSAAWLIIVIVLVVNMGLLIFLSIKSPPEIYGDFIWTYVRETRYYAPVLIFFQIYLLHIFFSKSLNRIPQFLLTTFLIAGFTYSFGHSAYRYGQRIIKNNPKETRFDQENCVMKKQLALADNSSVWVSEKGVFSEDEATVMGWKGVPSIEMQKLVEKGIHSSKEIKLLLKVKKDRIQELVANFPKMNTSSFTAIPICEKDTVYQLMYSPDEN